MFWKMQVIHRFTGEIICVYKLRNLQMTTFTDKYYGLPICTILTRVGDHLGDRSKAVMIHENGRPLDVYGLSDP